MSHREGRNAIANSFEYCTECVLCVVYCTECVLYVVCCTECVLYVVCCTECVLYVVYCTEWRAIVDIVLYIMEVLVIL